MLIMSLTVDNFVSSKLSFKAPKRQEPGSIAKAVYGQEQVKASFTIHGVQIAYCKTVDDKTVFYLKPNKVLIPFYKEIQARVQDAVRENADKWLPKHGLRGSHLEDSFVTDMVVDSVHGPLVKIRSQSVHENECVGKCTMELRICGIKMQKNTFRIVWDVCGVTASRQCNIAEDQDTETEDDDTILIEPSADDIKEITNGLLDKCIAKRNEIRLVLTEVNDYINYLTAPNSGVKLSVLDDISTFVSTP